MGFGFVVVSCWAAQQPYKCRKTEVSGWSGLCNLQTKGCRFRAEEVELTFLMSGGCWVERLRVLGFGGACDKVLGFQGLLRLFSFVPRTFTLPSAPGFWKQPKSSVHDTKHSSVAVRISLLEVWADLLGLLWLIFWQLSCAMFRFKERKSGIYGSRQRLRSFSGPGVEAHLGAWDLEGGSQARALEGLGLGGELMLVNSFRRAPEAVCCC